MDTKWKSNNHKSVGIACAIVLLLTGIFLAFLPLFEERAEREFENPFTSVSFIRILYENSYVEYKYLRERADQRTYSFGDLYVEAEYVATESEAYGREGMAAEVYSLSEEAVEMSSALGEEVKSFQESSVSELWEYKSQTQELTQMMDYYAVDEESGISIGNSSLSALKDIADGVSPEGNPYVYYVYLNFDGVGNLESCSVSTVGNADDFLKRVEAMGREQLLEENYNEDGVCYVSFYNTYADEFYRYRFTVKRPSDMKIVYAMTEEQYLAFMDGYDQYPFLASYVLASENSYYNTGVAGTVFCFFAAAMLLGAGMVYLGNRREKGAYTYQELKVCRLPLELNLILVVAGTALSEVLVKQICAYVKGWFLPNLTGQIWGPLRLELFRLPIFAAMFFLYFLMAYTLGSVLPAALHLRRYCKEHSIIYRYWDRGLNYLKSFYRELVNFDIGTDARRIITKLVIVNFIILTVMSMFWVWGVFFIAMYSLILYFLLKKYVKDIQDKYRNLLKATSSIARGDLDIVLSEDFGVFESYKKELWQIQRDFKRAVEEEVKSQRMKSELITNVSHDLKTPLTAIITYINLLKEPGITEEQRQEYIDTLDKKAVRLKILIEDLFEVSKATTNNITLNYDQVDICNLVRQCYLEYEDRIEAANLQFKFMLPEEKVFLTLDPQKTFRIFENLYTNTVKYALPATRVYVTVRELTESVEIEIKNISRTELNVSPEELTERFVRGDGSRNTEGSGLGLAIARSFTELQHGTLHIMLDGDLFKVLLSFRKWNGPKEPEAENMSASGATSGEQAQDAGTKDRNQTQNAGTKSGNQTPPKPALDPRRWRSEKNLRKKKWK